MKIDIEPIIEIATGLDKLRLQTQGLDALYFVRLANGAEFTVKWDRDGLENFLPNKTVSEMMKLWEEGIIRDIEKNKKAVETGEHPTWTQPVYEDVEYFGRFKKKQIGTKPYKLNDYSIENFKMFVERDIKKLGKMEFVKLV